MEMQNNERVELHEGSTGMPSEMSNFLANIPKQGNVKTDEESDKKGEGEGEEKKIDPLKDEEGGEEEKKKEEEEAKKLEEQKKEPTKDEEKKEVETVEDSIILSLAGAFENVEVEGEFEDTEEGLIAVTKQIVEKSVAKAKEQGVEEEYAKHPLLKEVKDHIATGGSIYTLLQTKKLEDFSKVEIKEDNIEQQEKFITMLLATKNFDEEEIEEYINHAKNDGSLFKKSGKAKESIVAMQSEQIKENLRLEKVQYEADIKEQQETVKSIRGFISSGTVNGFKITSDTGKRLEKFALEEDAKGETERDRKYASLTPEQWLALDMVVMDDFKSLTGKAEIANKDAKPLKLTIKKADKTINMSSSKGGGNPAGKAFKDLFNKPSDMF